jgi:hypothetical protein
VTAGQKLVQLESQSLSEQIIIVEGELAEATQQLQNLELADLRFELNSQPDDQTAPDRTQTASEIKRLKAKTETLQERQLLLQQQVDELLLVSPIAGQVTTQDVDRRLDSRPVSRGDLLMAVAAMNGEWEIELSLPDNRVEFVEAADDPVVRFRIAADSESIYQGTIRELDFRTHRPTPQAEWRARAIVDFDETDLAQNLRLGSRVVAKIDCGKRNNLFLLTYELRNKLREWFFF